MPGAYGAEAFSINDRGQVVGESFGADGFSAVEWDHEQITALTGFPGSPDSEALAINNEGLMAGYSQIAVPESATWR